MMGDLSMKFETEFLFAMQSVLVTGLVQGACNEQRFLKLPDVDLVKFDRACKCMQPVVAMLKNTTYS